MPCGVRAGLAAFAFLAVAATPASGQVGTPDPVQRSQAIERQLSQFRQQYAEVSAAEADLLARLDLARQTKDAADAELADLDTTLQQAVDAVAAAQRTRDDADQAATTAAAQLAGARVKADAARSVLQHQAVDAYIGQGRFGVLTAQLQHLSEEDALTSLYYAELAGGVQAGRVVTAQATREAVSAAEQVAAVAAARATSATHDVERRQADVQHARDAQVEVQQSAAAEVANEEQLLGQLQQQKSSYAAQVQSLQSDAQQIAQMLRQRATTVVSTRPTVATTAKATPSGAKATPTTAKPAPPPPATSAATSPPTSAKAVATTAATPSPVTSYPQDNSSGTPPVTMALGYPIPGAPIVSGFGVRIDPVLNTRLFHEGIDIWAAEGTPIHAAGPGTVVWAGDRHGYGNAVFIDHGRGVVTIYAHQSKVAVSVGQHVGGGDVIGYVGHTGLAGGPHLHFEVRVNGTAYDPLKFVSPR